MAANESTVYVIDDDASVRQSVEWLCRSADLNCVTYSGIEDFLDDLKTSGPSCLVLDLRLGSNCGLELMEHWQNRGEAGMPTIIVTGTAEIPLVAKSFKYGAFDLLEKPANPQVLIARIREALQADEKRKATAERDSGIRKRLERLTNRERELLKLVCRGMSSQQIANQLYISIKTVSQHRAHLLAKMQVENTADMVRQAVLANAA